MYFFHPGQHPEQELADFAAVVVVVVVVVVVDFVLTGAFDDGITGVVVGIVVVKNSVLLIVAVFRLEVAFDLDEVTFGFTVWYKILNKLDLFYSSLPF